MRSPAAWLTLPRVVTGLWFLKASVTKLTFILAGGRRMNDHPDTYLFTIIKQGGQAVQRSQMMPPWGTHLTDQQIWDLIAYVRSLAVSPYGGR